MKRYGRWFDVVLVATTVGGSAAVLAFLPMPYLYVAGLWVVFFALATIRARSDRKFIWFNLLIVPLTLGALEAYMWIPGGVQEELTGVTSQRDDVLGYAPNPGAAIHHLKTFNFKEKIIHDVTYTIGPDGLRVTPSADKGLPCVLFFGGSFTFGSGVADDQTMPYQVAIRVADLYRVHNFGYRGYGPHQMLSRLQHGEVAEKIDCSPQYVIYSVIGGHLNRVAGRGAWDDHGPWYEIQDGELVRRGNFDDDPQRGSFLKKQLQKSLLIGKVLAKFDHPDPPVQSALFGKIVEETADFIAKNFPESEFLVIFWDRKHDALEIAIQETLAELGLPVYKVSEIIPDFDESRAQYEINRHDRHPSPLALRLVAEFIVANILEGRE